LEVKLQFLVSYESYADALQMSFFLLFNLAVGINVAPLLVRKRKILTLPKTNTQNDEDDEDDEKYATAFSGRVLTCTGYLAHFLI
jgi:hypothetical protein